MATRGTVRVWHDDEGRGVADSPETPGGCWVGSGQVAAPGYRTLQPGQEVEHEAAAQDGYVPGSAGVADRCRAGGDAG